jgi:hypothetical protein
MAVRPHLNPLPVGEEERRSRFRSGQARGHEIFALIIRQIFKSARFGQRGERSLFSGQDYTFCNNTQKNLDGFI